jgi:hypothetical protein
MKDIVIDPEFPDTYYELNLTSLDGIKAPILQTLVKSAKLVDGVYHHRNGYKMPVNELMCITRNERGTNMCRHIYCLEQDIPKAIERMREDILKEARHMFSIYQEKLEVFQMDLVKTEEKHLWTTRFADEVREQVGADSQDRTPLDHSCPKDKS